jgi:hypothetical protein
VRLFTALFVAMFLIPSASAFAQGTGSSDRGDQSSNSGPASENRDSGPYGGVAGAPPFGADPSALPQGQPGAPASNRE